MYRVGANQVAIATSGTLGIFVDGSQNVGIGTSTIPKRLNVSGQIDVSDVSLPYIEFARAGAVMTYIGTGNGGSIVSTAAANDTFIRAENSLVIATGAGAGQLRVDIYGNVILAPTASAPSLSNGQLVINATSNSNLRFSYKGGDGTVRVANLTLT
jgi:hypothetical protein